jgi:Uma2 family endonuclease
LGASEPEPDITVVAVDGARPYHPGTAALAIEVSHSSRRRDLHVKPRIDAAGGIPRYWVIDLDHRSAVEHTGTAEDRYERVETVPRQGTLAAPELGISLSLAELLASPSASRARAAGKRLVTPVYKCVAPICSRC